MKKTKQIEQWEGEFGKAYTARNLHAVEDLDESYRRLFGVSRSQMNEEFIGGLDRSMRVLEVGTNVGAQLLMLQKMGFHNLYGIEIQERAIEFSRSISKGLNIIKGSSFDIPFKDDFFDMVYTSGGLIHISPEDIEVAISEIRRCTRRYIWGFEYYNASYAEVPYRGEKNLLWKTDFARLYMDTCGDLRLIKEKKFKYLENENMDQIFLLETKQL